MTEGKKSVLGFLKTLVAEEVPDKPASPATEAHASSVAPAAAPVHSFARAGGGAAEPDPQALAKLEHRLQAACPAPYVAFMEQYEALREDIPDERTRFKVSLKTSHTTAGEVLGAIDQLLSAMGTAKDEFMHSFNDNRDKRVSAAQAAIAASDELIKSSEEQIQAIQEKIASLRTKRATDAENMQEEGRRLDAILGGFNAAHAQVVSKLTDQKNRIGAMPESAKA